MRNNVEKVLERDQKLNELDEKADALQDGASQFEKSAGKLKNKFWMENLKSIVAGTVIGLFVLGLIYWKFFSEPDAPPHYNNNNNYQQQEPGTAEFKPAQAPSSRAEAGEGDE
jgi:predicted negative regulator of RcsB-dependent stress response